MKLLVMRGEYAVCRMASDAPIPQWALAGFFSITRTAEELSIVCADQAVPKGVRAERGWRGFQIVGPIPFELFGVLNSLTQPLAVAKISLFAISTFDTDYLLVKAQDFDRAFAALRDFGHEIVESPA